MAKPAVMTIWEVLLVIRIGKLAGLKIRFKPTNYINHYNLASK